jgi:hypothetical protein
MHLIFTSICLNSNVVQITQKYLVAYIVVLGVQEAPFLISSEKKTTIWFNQLLLFDCVNSFCFPF